VAARHQYGVFAEGGSHGLLVDYEVGYHRNGIVAVLAHYGIVDQPIPTHQPLLLTGYQFLRSPSSGWSRSLVRAGQWVDQGQPLATIADQHGQLLEPLVAPLSGYILWRVTHPIVAAGDPLVGLGTLPT
jgi:predicted deacylase